MSLDRKEETEVVVRTEAGREFHILEAGTENAAYQSMIWLLQRKEQRSGMMWLMNNVIYEV